MKLTHSPSEMDLPPAWHALAKGPKKEERGILEAALREQARSPNAATTTSLIVSKDLHSTIVNLTFWSGDPDNLNAGLQPFRAAYTSTAKTSADLAHLQTYDQLATDGILALQDIHTFQHVLKSEWPTGTSYLLLYTTLKSYHNLLVVLLKATHPYSLKRLYHK